MTAMSQYKVTYELDRDGWWFTQIPAIPGCHTQGSTLPEAKDRIRECLALYVPAREAADAEFIDAIELPASISEAVKTIASYGLHAVDVGVLLDSVSS